jgi:hypothetical protein
MGVLVGVGVSVGVWVGVGVFVGVAVAVSTNGKTATAPTAPSSLICCSALRSSPGKAPSSAKVAARALIISDGTIMPQSQIMAIKIANRRNLAPSVRLANQTDRLRLYWLNLRLEIDRGWTADFGLLFLLPPSFDFDET